MNLYATFVPLLLQYLPQPHLPCLHLANYFHFLFACLVVWLCLASTPRKGSRGKRKKTSIYSSPFISSLHTQGAYRKITQVIFMNSRFQARSSPGQALFWFILKSKRGTSLMESIFSRCHNYMYSHRLIKSKIFINECNKQIYTAPNSLIVHGVLH